MNVEMPRRLLKITLKIVLFCLLTALTQVGGLVYLLSVLTYRLTDKWTDGRFLKTTYRFISFLILYGLTTFLIVPIIAKPLGRVPLPLTETNHLQPLNILTCLLNRNYVRPELRQTAFEVAKQMSEKYPGTITNYLEANLPFIDAIGKIFIEPHLKTRLNLTSDKIRFHGCQAVRHDDHVHVQLK